MEKLGSVFTRYSGMDSVEIIVCSGDDDILRLSVPARIDARNDFLLSQVRDIVGKEGQVSLV
jgi:DNA polymerase-3 subunit alpha